MRILTYEISEEITAERFLRGKRYSGTILTQLRKREGALTVNGKSALTKTVLKPGDTLAVRLTETSAYRAVPNDIPLDIAYEDEDLLVLNKPAGMFVMPHVGAELDLFSALAFRYGGSFVPHVVTRLDRDTSGLMLVAKHALAHSVLNADLAAGKVVRKYLGLASGRLLPAEGEIDAPIARCEGSMMRRVDELSGKRAVTRYRTAACRAESTLFEAELVTGRTHQIRVHMAYLGHPLVGDQLYGGGLSVCGRIALHASALAFTHPVTGGPMCFESAAPF